MSRSAESFTLHSRKSNSGVYYYAQFRDNITGKRLSAISTGQTNLTNATKWAKEQLSNGKFKVVEKWSPTSDIFESLKIENKELADYKEFADSDPFFDYHEKMPGLMEMLIAEIRELKTEIRAIKNMQNTDHV